MAVCGCCCGHDEVAGKRPIGPLMPARLGEMSGVKSVEAEYGRSNSARYNIVWYGAVSKRMEQVQLKQHQLLVKKLLMASTVWLISK
jgi:hypothetical protein